MRRLAASGLRQKKWLSVHHSVVLHTTWSAGADARAYFSHGLFRRLPEQRSDQVCRILRQERRTELVESGPGGLHFGFALLPVSLSAHAAEVGHIRIGRVREAQHGERVCQHHAWRS